jgi:hypothetical protein
MELTSLFDALTSLIPIYGPWIILKLRNYGDSNYGDSALNSWLGASTR